MYELETNFYRLDNIEKNVIWEHGKKYHTCASTKADICHMLCDIDSVCNYYPEFENDYDAVMYIEQVRFGEIVNSDFYECYINTATEEYKAYKKQLYSKTIETICNKYLVAVVFDLSTAELSEVLSIYRDYENIIETS